MPRASGRSFRAATAALGISATWSTAPASCVSIMSSQRTESLEPGLVEAHHFVESTRRRIERHAKSVPGVDGADRERQIGHFLLRKGFPYLGEVLIRDTVRSDPRDLLCPIQRGAFSSV